MTRKSNANIMEFKIIVNAMESEITGKWKPRIIVGIEMCNVSGLRNWDWNWNSSLGSRDVIFKLTRSHDVVLNLKG